MPLHCPRVYILFLLPLIALSCSNLKSPSREHYSTINTELDNTIEDINNLLLQHKNKNCSDYTPKVTCASSNFSHVVTNLFNITCKMKNLQVNLTEQLTNSVQTSVACPCSIKSTKQPKTRDTTPINEGHKDKKHIRKKLCKIKTLLLSLKECFQLLNSVTPTGRDTGE